MLIVVAMLLTSAAAAPHSEAATGASLESFDLVDSVRPSHARCAKTKDPDEITVCARRQDNLRYRLPAGPPEAGKLGAESVTAERYRWSSPRAEGGPGSCTTVGPFGMKGCNKLRWEYQQLQNAGRKPSLVDRALTYLDPGE